MLNGHILVDFDGTLSGDPGHGKPYKPDETGPPIQEMVDRVKHWLACNIEVKIFTGRVADDPEQLAELAIKKWCLKHIGKELEVTNKKDANTFALWDDRAVRVEKDTGVCISYHVPLHDKETPREELYIGLVRIVGDVGVRASSPEEAEEIISKMSDEELLREMSNPHAELHNVDTV